MDRARLMAEVRKLESLPTLPSIAAKVIDATLSDESSPEDLARLIKADHALTLKILRVANSAFYRRSRQVSQVKDAILLMGLNAIKSLVLSISVYELFDKVEAGGGVDRQQFWLHSVAAATGARLIAARFGMEHPEEAFVGGLLHDVGKIVMEHFDSVGYNRAIGLAMGGGKSLIEAEREQFGYDHCEAGKWVLERWQLPEKLVEAVWLHHQGRYAAGGGERQERLALAVGLGDAAANEQGYGFDLRVAASGAVDGALKGLGLKASELESIGGELRESLPAMAGLFGLEIPTREDYIKRLQRANVELGRLSLELEQVNGELSGKLSERAALYRICEKVASRLELDEVAELLVESAVSGLGVKAARCRLALGRGRELLAEAALTRGGKLKKGVRLIEGSVSGGEEGSGGGEEGVWVSVEIGLGRGEPAGALSVLSDGSASAEHLGESLSALARMGGVALENAGLYAQLRERAEKLARAHQRIGMVLEEVTSVHEKMAQVERLKAFGELAGGLAHNFNNLLGTILGRVQLMLRQSSDQEVRGDLRLIEKCALDGAEMVKRIQQFGRREGSEGYARVDLNELVEEVLAMTENRWKASVASGEAIGLDLRLGQGAQVRGNRAELREVLTNVVLNAVDAMASGGRLGVETGRRGASVHARISDTGEGMSPEVMEKIFNPFFTTKGSRGTGLGLSITYSIVAGHRGRISVKSKPGEGSVFTITLPAASGASGEEEKVEKRPKSGPRARILVIDDEKGMREVLYDILVALGHTVEVAEDGEKGLARFKESKTELVITDLAMAGMNGLEVAKAVKRIEPQTRVILLTGWGVQLDQDKVAQSGINMVMAKPFTLVDLNKAISELIDGR